MSMDTFSADELSRMREQCEAFEGRFGPEMRHDYGWASPTLKVARPNFSQIENAVDLKHWRPRFRWASQHTHSPYRPSHAFLGTAETTQPVHLVGRSNSGFTDPLHMTAIALSQATGALMSTRPDFDTAVFLRVIDQLTVEIGDAALAVDNQKSVPSRRKRKPAVTRLPKRKTPPRKKGRPRPATRTSRR
jgi:hypothetical protein